MNEITTTKITIIKSLYDELNRQMYKSVETAIELGEELLEVKRVLDHGQFKPWIDENFPFSYATARRYMTVALNKRDLKKKISSDKQFSLTDAYSSVFANATKRDSKKSTVRKMQVPKQITNRVKAMWKSDRKYAVNAVNGNVLMKTDEMRTPVMVCTVTTDPKPGCEAAFEELNSGLEALFIEYYAKIEAFETGVPVEQDEPEPILDASVYPEIKVVSDMDGDEEQKAPKKRRTLKSFTDGFFGPMGSHRGSRGD